MRKLTDCVEHCVTAYKKMYGEFTDRSMLIHQKGDIADLTMKRVVFKLCLFENGWNVTNYEIIPENCHHFDELIKRHEEIYEEYCENKGI